MFIVVLLCQVYFAHPISFRVLMPNLYLILKILHKLKALVLMMKLLMQKLRNLVGMISGRMIPVESKILMQVIQRVLVRLLGSEAVPPKLLAIGNWLVIFQSSTFVFDLLICVLLFQVRWLKCHGYQHLGKILWWGSLSLPP